MVFNWNKWFSYLLNFLFGTRFTAKFGDVISRNRIVFG